jgi:tetratricopeptide (TPR) repeat protein
LQQGRYSKASELFSTLRQSMKESPVRRIQSTYVDMATAYIVETERWDEAEKLLNAPELKSEAQRAEQGAVTGQHCSHGASVKPEDSKTAQTPPAAYGREGRSARPAFALGMAAGATGKLADVEKYIIELAGIRKLRSERGELYSAKQVEIMELGVTAFATATQGHVEQAITLMKKATALEESLDAPSGPPDLLKPAHELFGEILLRAGRPKEAAEQFRIALLRQPNRARSLLGAARAARESGDQTTAAAGYANLARVWQKADAQLPALKEVQDQSAKVSPR